MARIALDASGGDFAPAAPVEGALDALQGFPPSGEILLLGPQNEVEAEFARHGPIPPQIRVVDAPDKITMADKPLAAIRGKRRSSIVVGMEMHRAGEVDAFISAGNTGAMMAAGTLMLGLHRGVERPAIGAVLPSVRQPVLLVDAGANVDCSPRELLGFAQLGAVYARDVLDRTDPSVGLLTIGEEPEKGNVAVKEAHKLMQETSHFRFAGNLEGKDILTGACDVVVCDGFVGNIVLKFYEAVGRIIQGRLELELAPDVVASPAMGRVFEFLDYATYGGAPLLGVRGVPVICHGRSSPRAIASALRVALHAVENRLNQHIGDEFVTDEVRA